MDLEAESRRAKVEQFKRDRWPYTIGHVGATVSVIAIAWTTADHNSHSFGSGFSITSQPGCSLSRSTFHYV